MRWWMSESSSAVEIRVPRPRRGWANLGARMGIVGALGSVGCAVEASGVSDVFDAGVNDVAAQEEKAQTRVLGPSADAYIDATRGTSNFGFATEVRVDLAPAETRALLRFAIPEVGRLVSAKLRLFVTNGSPNGPSLRVTGNGWSESGVTWATRPSSSGTTVANLGNAGPGWVEMDVSRAVATSGTYSFYLFSESEDGLVFSSREGGKPPQLVLTTTSSSDLCPTDSSKDAPGLCGCGVPDTDSDGDGVPNCREQTNLTFPVRGAFYYAWYPQTWTVSGKKVFYRPTLGYYDSGDINVIDRHLAMLDYAKVDLAIVSWWGRNTQEEATRIRKLLDRTVARNSRVKWAFLHEDEGFGDPSASTIATDLAYLEERYANSPAVARINGKPIIFVYAADDGSCEIATRWAQANAKRRWFVNLKIFPNFEDCSNQPDTWHQYGPNTPAQHHRGYSYVISPGFWRADKSAPSLGRSVSRFQQNVRDMVASRERWQLITTFNEWGEGTAVEPASQWSTASGFGAYLDALHSDGR